MICRSRLEEAAARQFVPEQDADSSSSSQFILEAQTGYSRITSL